MTVVASATAIDDTLGRELPAAAGGCQQAYGRIVMACQNTVTSIALAITRDVQASEDIAQETFLRAWQQLSRLNNHASFLPWLRQITRNLARDWLRANRGRPMTGEAAEIAIGMAADPSPSPAQRLLRVEEEVVAEDIISALPEESRETLLLYYREGQSSQQVANLLGLSDAAVRKRLSRARASVREQMLQRFGEFARSTAPGVAFATTVASMLMIAAPGTASAAIIATTGAGTAGMSKFGLGVSSAANGSLFGSLGVVVQQNLIDQGISPSLLAGVIGALIGGTVGAYAGGRFLLGYAHTPQEKAQVSAFVRMNSLTSLVVCLGILAASLFAAPGWALLLVTVAGMGVINYQCLVTLQRVMAPMLARDAARHGRSAPDWKYRMLYGRDAIICLNILIFGVIIWSLSKG